MLNFARSSVKHGTQNIQNDCYQWLSDIKFVPTPLGIELTALPRRPSIYSWFMGPYF